MEATLSKEELRESAEYRGSSIQYDIDTGNAEKHFNTIINENGPAVLKAIKSLGDKLSDLK